MASGILTIPAQHVEEVIHVIRAGLDKLVSEHEMSYEDPVYINLTNWCEDMEDFLMMFQTKNKGDGDGRNH